MTLVASFVKYKFIFKTGATTSRGVMTSRDSWFISIHQRENPEINGWGECAPLPGLSIDDRPDYEKYLDKTCRNLEERTLPKSYEEMNKLAYELLPGDFPSMRFGLQTALLDLMNGSTKQIFHTDFVKKSTPININGLIWMSAKASMIEQIDDRLANGFNTIKLKVGAINLKDELEVVSYLREKGGDKLDIRLDANGAFKPEEALGLLKQFAPFKIHSIEQPIKARQREAMAKLCAESPIPIALDEELIGTSGIDHKARLLDTIKPQFIILKPSLLGGFRSCQEWIDVAEQRKIGWWLTSALESNIGLNAISQFASTFKNPLPQGLGTGQLYKNNFPSPLEVNHGHLTYGKSPWDVRLLNAWSVKV